VKIFDAIVAGAGPAGSTAAKVLGEAGASVLLLDKKRVSARQTLRRRNQRAGLGAIPLSEGCAGGNSHQLGEQGPFRIAVGICGGLPIARSFVFDDPPV
jgi:glycine/D-amino acid oxidase-like deaminating enzyme